LQYPEQSNISFGMNFSVQHAVQQPLIQSSPTYLTSSSNPFGNSFINNACVPQQQQLFTSPPQQMPNMPQQNTYPQIGSIFSIKIG